MIHIREAVPTDTDEIVELWIQLINQHKEFDKKLFSGTTVYTSDYRAEIESHFNNPSKMISIAVKRGIIIGYVTAAISAPEHVNFSAETVCKVEDIMITDGYQRLGIGNMFLEEVKNWALAHEKHKIVISVFAKNNKGMKFVKHEGFKDGFNDFVLDI